MDIASSISILESFLGLILVSPALEGPALTVRHSSTHTIPLAFSFTHPLSVEASENAPPAT